VIAAELGEGGSRRIERGAVAVREPFGVCGHRSHEAAVDVRGHLAQPVGWILQRSHRRWWWRRLRVLALGNRDD
jgi:hypothetical protein